MDSNLTSSTSQDNLNINQVLTPLAAIDQQESITKNKIRPSPLVLIPLIGYALALLLFPGIYLLGGIFYVAIFGTKSDPLLSSILVYTIWSLIFSIIFIIISFFYYSKITRIFLIVSILLPLLFGGFFLSRLSGQIKIEENKDIIMEDFDSEVYQILTSVKNTLPFIYEFCNSSDRLYCPPTRLYSDKSGEISEEEMVILKNSLSKIASVKNKYIQEHQNIKDRVIPDTKIIIYSQKRATSSYQEPVCLNNEYYNYSCSITTEVNCVKEIKSCN